MKRVGNLYQDISNFYHIVGMTDKVCKSVRNKKKVDNFESFKSEHIYNIYKRLKNKDFSFSKYSIFMIYDPKCRIVMAQNIEDKIINHLVSEYVLKKVFDSKFTNILCATRNGYGTLYGIKLLKRYLNEMKCKYDNFYILKLDIKKYFYSINHDILKSILIKKIKDKDVLLLLDKIIDSTNDSYINKRIIELKNNRILYLKKSNLINKDILIKEVEEIPLYRTGYGIALGDETSQCFGLIFLYEIAHFIREELKLHRICIYMDDMIIIHHDKDYLNYCLDIIVNKLREYKLDINFKKTRIDSIKNGIDFLGYRFFIYNKKVILRLRNRTKKKYKKKIKDIGILYRNKYIDYKKFFIGLNSYNGILKWGNCKRLIYERDVIYILENYYKYKINYKDSICIFRIGIFYEIFDRDALIINKIFNYKVKNISNTFKVGFPVKNIDKVINMIKDNHINYIFIDNYNIIDKYEDKYNRYNSYFFNINLLNYQCVKVDRIIKVLENNKLNLDFNDKLIKIDELLKGS